MIMVLMIMTTTMMMLMMIKIVRTIMLLLMMMTTTIRSHVNDARNRTRVTLERDQNVRVFFRCVVLLELDKFSLNTPV